MNKYNLLEKMLSNTASEEEQQQFREWINESSENKKEFDQLKLAWEKMDIAFLTKSFDTFSAKNKVKQQVAGELIKRQQKRTIQIKRMAFAATFVLLVALGFFVYMQNLRYTASHQVYTAGNRVTEIILSDSTHVWLNANTTLETAKRFGHRRRKVILTGEAFFEVKRDETKPFKVLTGNTLTRVLGTSFNLLLDEKNNVTLTVNSGKVEFYKKNKLLNRPIYTAGEIGVFDEGTGKATRDKNGNVNYLAWKTGVLCFRNTPLDEVCNTLNKHYGKVITTSIPKSDFTLTATYSNETLENIIATICITLDIEATAKGNTIVLYQ